MAATTISRATLTDSVSAITGDIWNAALVGTAIYDKVDALLTASLRIERSSSGDIAFTVAGASNTSGSDSQLVAVVAGTSAGDPYATFTVTSGSSWSLGTDNSDSDSFKLCPATSLSSDVFVVTTGGKVLIGDSANATMTIGLTINQAANDDEILALKSSDVGHGMTSLSETDTFCTVTKVFAGEGGVLFRGMTDTGVTGGALFFQGVLGSAAADTTKSAAGVGIIRLSAGIKSGTTAGAAGANENLMTIENLGTTRFIFDAEGDSHEDGTGWTAYDDFDDLALIASVEGELAGDQLRDEFKGWMRYNRDALQQARLVTFNADGRHFVNRSRMQMALCGAVRQLGMRQQALDQRLLALGA